MRYEYSTGNAIVDEIATINFTGNIIPVTWFQTMKNGNGKPVVLAILILSDIVYWYRPYEIRDEASGNLIRYSKRFKADYLQRSYRQLEERFNVSKKQARTALDFLCEIGVIKKHFRDDVLKNGTKLHNNMYLELIPQKLRELTFPEKEGLPLREPPCAIDGTTVDTLKTEGSDFHVPTSTKNTTNNTYRDSINLIGEQDTMDEIDCYEAIVKEQIDYESLTIENHGADKEKIDEIVNMIVDIAVAKREKITIGGVEYPYELVKSRLLKIGPDHIRYLLESLKKNHADVRNMKAYLLASLYNSLSTMDHYYQMEASHDIYHGL